VSKKETKGKPEEKAGGKGGCRIFRGRKKDKKTLNFTGTPIVIGSGPRKKKKKKRAVKKPEKESTIRD